MVIPFTSPSAITESSCCSSSLSAFDVVSVLDFSHYNRRVVISHDCFSLQFPKAYDIEHFFMILIYHLYIFFREMSVQILCSFFNWDVFLMFKEFFCSGCWCSVDWAPACKPKGLQFNSQSGHMPGLHARSPIGGTWEAITHWCVSPSLSPSLPLSLKINK